MNIPLLIGIITAVIVIYSIINAISKSKHPIKKSITGVMTGFVALIVVNLLTPLTSVSVPISIMSVLVAAIGGLPGVTLILAFNAFL